MKTWIRAVALGVTGLSIPLIGAVGNRQFGERISDREAATLRGGCPGAASVGCPDGPKCPASGYVTLGHGTNQTATGTAYCGGSMICSEAFSGTKKCAG